MNTNKNQPVAVEFIKENSNFLRGTIASELGNEVTGSISENDTQISKFHGIYQQDDRDLRKERSKQKLEPLYSFMIRARVPGGICTPEQWLAIDDMADRYANGSIRITTRQAFQFHGVIKKNLKPTIAAINQQLMDTIAACGDVNRNVMCTANPELSSIHYRVYQDAKAISDHLTPQTSAYHEIWIDGEKVKSESKTDHEPIYGKTYLPRKFKIAVVIPPDNDVDVLAHDLGFIAIIENHELVGYNVTVGGGMGTTHGDSSTFPLLAHTLGFCTPDQVLLVAENTVKIQRDHGDRTNRKHARFKYTVDDHGIDWLRGQLSDHMGQPLLAAKKIEFTHNGDRFGWRKNLDGSWNHTLFIANGRVKDDGMNSLRTALREIAQIHQGNFRLTANQNLIIAQVPDSAKNQIDQLLGLYKINQQVSLTRQLSMACVALPTCSLAMAEAERYLPELINQIDGLQQKHHISNRGIMIRMTGCPNGCARPFIAEIGFVGKALGRYNMYLGGKPDGTRLNQLYLENITESDILKQLDDIFSHYAKDAISNESFGDFVIRAQYVSAVTHGKQVHLKWVES
ncbi:NADPH-dependent assimilatory sulfite reductase hemoprotein subunit [Marinicella litoralis]|uniref:Sulfite reductase [NADPH] hemoprotein beta-component n=1 Tax=Marinicella litoralis TaxID=644220 RepID=A0A4R6XG85_9GAMM|nr:NADPH-dependent assimilatory sulfite reductase hemoprotein subunit [Marinicella litoralis]TDR18405.1 sulfite reductase (NADPH) beta subunit [Marinicella litoralis]